MLSSGGCAALSRDTDLRRNGWVTLYYGPNEVFGRPWLIAPEVRDLVRRRAPHLLTAQLG